MTSFCISVYLCVADVCVLGGGVGQQMYDVRCHQHWIYCLAWVQGDEAIMTGSEDFTGIALDPMHLARVLTHCMHACSCRVDARGL